MGPSRAETLATLAHGFGWGAFAVAWRGEDRCNVTDPMDNGGRWGGGLSALRDGGMWRWELSGEGVDGRRGWMLTMEGKTKRDGEWVEADGGSSEWGRGEGLRARACMLGMLRWRIGESNSGFHEM